MVILFYLQKMIKCQVHPPVTDGEGNYLGFSDWEDTLVPLWAHLCLL